MTESNSLYSLIEKFKQSEVVNQETGEITYLDVDFSPDDFTREKIDRCVMYLRDLQGRESVVSELAREVNSSAKTYEKTIEAFKKYLLFCLEKSAQEYLQGNAFKIGNRKGKESVEIINTDLIPFQYLKTKQVIDVDKKGLTEAIKAGEIIEGARLVLGESTISISKGATK